MAQEASELQIVKSRETLLERCGIVLAPVIYSILAVLWVIVVVGTLTQLKLCSDMRHLQHHLSYGTDSPSGVARFERIILQHVAQFSVALGGCLHES